MITNLRIAIRGFLRTPAFTATALLTLAICLGANLTIFSVVDSVLLRPLPFPDGDQLVTMYNSYPKAGVPRDGSSITNYYERRGNIPALSHISLFRSGTVIVGDAGATERNDVMRVSPEFFATLGVGPVLGRAFTEEETVRHRDDVTVLTDSYWRQRFNADASVLGRTIRVDGVQRTIVGVLGPEFRFLSSQARLFLPLASDLERRAPNERHSGSGVDIVARLGPGASLSEAQSQIDAHNATMERTNPIAKMIADAGFRSIVVPLHADHVSSIGPTLVLMQGGVLLLVLIGGVNLANLLLIRASARTRELAIRQSMGASRRHVVEQVLLETIVLSVAGGVFGLAVGAGGIRLLEWLGADQLPLGAYIALDGRLALMALLGAVVFGIAIALPIAWFNLRGHLANALKAESRGGTANRGAQRLRHAFLVAQVSLAFVLLAGSGLLGFSLRKAMSVSPGFRSDHVLTGQIALPGRSYGSVPAIVSFANRLMDELRAQPGVMSVGVITNIPLSGSSNKTAVTVKGHVVRPGESIRGHYSYGVTGDYFAALGVPLREGRLLTAADVQRGDRLAVVDEDFARRYWPNGSAIGQQLFGGGEERNGNEPFTIVGVVGAVKQAEVTEKEAQGAVYFPLVHRADADLFVVTRTRQEPEALGETMARLVRRIDPDLPVDGVRSMDVRIAESLVGRRSPALLAAIFASVAVLLAAIGTYGVLSYAVAQRRREIGVRLALGAEPRHIGSQFLSLGLHLLAAGTILGVFGAWITGRLMQSLLFDVPAFHWATLLGTVVIMSVVSLVACLIPARRAARVDPMIVLAAE